EGSAAAVAIFLSSIRRSEIDSPAARDTSAIEVARFRLVFTASSEPMSARWFWAMAQMEALSLAPCTFRPVLIRLWTSVSRSLVRLRFCSAMSAEALVRTLFDMAFGPLGQDSPRGWPEVVCVWLTHKNPFQGRRR